MARIPWSDGMEIAAREAWRTKGKKHSTLLVYGRFIPWVLGAVALGALGYGAKWAWGHAAGAINAIGASTDTAPGAVAHAGVPPWIWIAGVVLIVATVVGVRGGSTRFRSFTEVMLTGVVLVIAWLAFAAFALGAL